jgi:hypothetical protein
MCPVLHEWQWGGLPHVSIIHNLVVSGVTVTAQGGGVNGQGVPPMPTVESPV